MVGNLVQFGLGLDFLDWFELDLGWLKLNRTDFGPNQFGLNGIGQTC